MTMDAADKLLTEVYVDPNVAQTLNQKLISNENVYDFMDNSLNGTGGYRDGSYLVAHDREMNYDSRRKQCYYRNFMKPILKAMIEPVFNEEALRVIQDTNGTIVEDSLLNEFIEDVTNTGMPMQPFTQEVLEYARLHGVCFVVMDNFEVQPATEKEAKDNRIYPYMYIKTSQQIKSENGFIVDKFGKLESITFTDKKDDKGNQLYRKWTKVDSTLVNDNGDAVEQPKVHNLGTVPVISVYCAKRKSNEQILVDPPLYDLAKINFTIFNKDSEIRDQERAQGFSVFYLQSDQTGNITLGNKNVLYLPIGSTIPPGFASPDAAILKGLSDSGEKLREDLFRIAQQNGVSGVQQGTSGIALQWYFFAEEAVLEKTSSLAEDFEEASGSMFCLYTKQPLELEVEYKDDFQPQDVTNQLANLDKAMLMDLPPLSKGLLKQKVVKLLFSDEDEETMKEVIDEIKLATEDEQLSGATETDETVTEIGGITGVAQ